jgi:hypothetical protein
MREAHAGQAHTNQRASKREGARMCNGNGGSRIHSCSSAAATSMNECKQGRTDANRVHARSNEHE